MNRFLRRCAAFVLALSLLAPLSQSQTVPPLASAEEGGAGEAGEPKYRKYSKYNSSKKTEFHRLVELKAFDDSVEVFVYGERGARVEQSVALRLRELGRANSGVTFDNGALRILGREIALDEVSRVSDSVYRHPSIPGVEVISLILWSSDNTQLDRRAAANTVLVAEELTIPASGFVRGSVICFGGVITVEGEVNHSVIAVGADVIALSGAVIRDHALSLGGSVRVDESARVYGHIIPHLNGKRPRLRHRPWDDERQTLHFEPSFSYNRVDGFTPQVGWVFRDLDSTLPTLRLDYGLATTSDRQRFRFAIDQPLFGRGRVSGFGSMYKQLTSDDDYLLPGWQNTVVGLLATTDYKNYYEAEGAELGLRYRPNADFSLSLGAHTEDLKTLPATPELWSLFGGDKRFPENYHGLTPAQQSAAIGEFDDRRHSALFVRAEITNSLGRRTSPSATGWRLAAEIERSLPDFDSEFSFTRSLTELSLSHQLTRYSEVELDALIGLSSGGLPLYRHFYLGGYRWLRGFERFEFVGESIWALALDYGISLDGAGLGALTVWMFYDIGSINELDLQRRYYTRYYNSVGLGLSVSRTIRINLARRLDRSDPDLRFSVEF